MTRKTLIVYSVIVLCLLPMILLRDYTPSNELRYLSIADEALRQHRFLVFTNHGVPYADKPPLFLWLVMLGRLLPTWLQHLAFGLLGLVPAVIVTEVTRNLFQMDDRHANLFRLVMFSTALPLVSMLTLRMDMLMTMFIMLAVAEFARLYRQNEPHESWRLPVFIFLAVFTKGGIGLLVPLVVIGGFLIIKGRGTDFFRYLGWRSWLLLLSLFGLWFLGVYLEGGGNYLYNLTVHQTLGRTFHSFHHRQPFYYYLYMIWPLLMPWSFWVIGAVIVQWKRATRLSDMSRMMLFASVTVFVLLSLISSKLSIYLLPLVPFVMGVAVTAEVWQSRWAHVSLAVSYTLLTLVAPVAVCLFLFSNILQSFNVPVLWAALITLSLGSLVALFVLAKQSVMKSVRLVSFSIFLCAFLAGWAMPKVNAYIGFKDVCGEALLQSEQHHGAKIVALGVRRSDNMDVYLGHSPKKITMSEVSRLHNVVVIMPLKDSCHLSLAGKVKVGNHVVGYLSRTDKPI